jgi:hypothetical protein
MSKRNNVSTLDHRPLADRELDTVVGGTSSSDWISWTRPLAPPIPYPGSNPGSNKGS